MVLVFLNKKKIIPDYISSLLHYKELQSVIKKGKLQQHSYLPAFTLDYFHTYNNSHNFHYTCTKVHKKVSILLISYLYILIGTADKDKPQV